MSSPDPITRRRSRIPDLFDLGGDIVGNLLARRTAGNAGNALRSGIDAAGQRISDASRRGMGFEEGALDEQRGLYGDRRRILREGLTRQEGLYGDQRDALDEGLTRQEGIYRERRGDFEPYAEGGREGISALRKLIEEDQGFDVSKVMDDPGYKFGMDEGVKGVGRFLSAKGSLGSGQVKDFIRFANDYATTKVNDAFSRHQQQRRSRFDEVMGLTGFGERAAANQSDVSGEFGRQIGDNAINQANITGRFADRVGDTAFGESDIAGDFGDQIGRSATNRSALTLAEGAQLADLEAARANVNASEDLRSGGLTQDLLSQGMDFLGGLFGEDGAINPEKLASMGGVAGLVTKLGGSAVKGLGAVGGKLLGVIAANPVLAGLIGGGIGAYFLGKKVFGDKEAQKRADELTGPGGIHDVLKKGIDGIDANPNVPPEQKAAEKEKLYAGIEEFLIEFAELDKHAYYKAKQTLQHFSEITGGGIQPLLG